MTDRFDIVFAGHMCYDEIVPYEGETRVAPGSAVLCGAMAAARIGAKVAAVVKMAPTDEPILTPMKAANVATFIIPASETSYMQVLHPTPSVDVREMFLRKNAGHLRPDEMPAVQTRFLHLAGISDQEFSLALMQNLCRRGYDLSVDMQSFVRQVNPVTREVSFSDVKAKAEIAAMVNRLKLDVVEAELLTGERDLEKAALVIESWGCPEIVITQAEGVLARVGGRSHYERFTNRSVIGRTGRGDTTFAGYLAWRIAHEPAESLKFAAALVSIKMETPGPFSGTLNDVLTRAGMPLDSTVTP